MKVRDIVRSLGGDTVDLVALRTYGVTAGATEAVYDANPGLAELGPVLPAGTAVVLPELTLPASAPLLQLWD